MTEQPESTSAKTEKGNKSAKKKGPIRFEAVGPILFIVAAIVIYTTLFLDLHLRHLLQWGLGFANGAEVNIGSLSTHFSQASLNIENIQLTDPEAPNTNRLHVGRVHFQMIWDGLLRGKFVVRDARIENLQIHTERKRTGWVTPPTPPANGSTGDAVKNRLLEMASKEFSGNALGDIASIFQGVDPSAQLKTIEGELKTNIRIKEIEEELKSKESAWQKRLSELPQSRDFEALAQKLKSIKTSGFQNPQELQSSVQQFQEVMREADAKVKLLDAARQDMGGDLNQLDQDYKNLQKYVQEDLRDLEKRFQIPNLDVKSLSKSLFGAKVSQWLIKGEHYLHLAQKYMPPKRDKRSQPMAAKDELTPHERAAGVNYVFGRPNSYPLFWLQAATISSQAEHSPFAGELKGTLTDLSSSPSMLSRPTVLSLTGDFPGQEIHNLDLNATLDHRTDQPKVALRILIGSYKVGERNFSNSDEVKFGMKSAVGNLNVNAVFENQQIDLNSHSRFDQIDYQVEAQNPEVAAILKGVSRDIGQVKVQANISGPWDALRFHIQSNLGDVLANGFRRQIQERIDKARKQLEEFVEQKVAGERKKLEEQLQQFNKQVQSSLQQAQAEADKIKNQAQIDAKKAEDQAKDEARRNLENAGKKALENLKDKFKF